MGGHNWIQQCWPQSDLVSELVWLLVILKCTGLPIQIASVVSLLYREPFRGTRIIRHKFVSSMDNSITVCFLWKLQIKGVGCLNTPKLSANIYPAMVFPPCLPILQGFIFLYFGGTALLAEVLSVLAEGEISIEWLMGWWEEGRMRDIRDERDGEGDYSREEERKSRRGNQKVYTWHLCIMGVAVLAHAHDTRLCDCFWMRDLLNIDGLIFTPLSSEI